MITKITKHDNHPMRIHLNKFGSAHFASLRCVKCNKHVQWLSVEETDRLANIGVEVYSRFKHQEKV